MSLILLEEIIMTNNYERHPGTSYRKRLLSEQYGGRDAKCNGEVRITTTDRSAQLQTAKPIAQWAHHKAQPR